MATRPPLDYSAAAAYLGSSERKLRELVSAGRLPHVRMGRKVRFLPDSLDAWLMAQQDIGADLRQAAADLVARSEAGSERRPDQAVLDKVAAILVDAQTDAA